MSLKSKIIAKLSHKPMTLKQLKSCLGSPKKVAALVAELERKRRIMRKHGRYVCCIPSASVTAALSNTQPAQLVKLGRGFGFARIEHTQEEIFIPGRYLKGAMPGEGIQVELCCHARTRGSREGRVRCITHEKERLSGTVLLQDHRLCFVPDSCPQLVLRIKKGYDSGAQPGEKVVALLLKRAERHREHRVGIAVRFGNADAAQHCAKAILFAEGIKAQFPEKVQREAQRLAQAGIAQSDLCGRVDLRKDVIFTIDGADTKDIDDAVSVRRLPDGYELGVHIADVSHYVRADTPLDQEAMQRGTSVYYADSVVPMLPKPLSNGICSLDQGADRLAFSCVMQLDKHGHVVHTELKKTVVHSCCKGVYAEVNALLEGSAAAHLQKKYAPIMPQLHLLQELYGHLALLHQQRGALEFETDEAKLITDESGCCVQLERRVRGVAERMIEECMLLANTCTAELARKRGWPFIYRTHAAPKLEKMQAVMQLLAELNLSFAAAQAVPSAKQLAQLLCQTANTPQGCAVHHVLLRAMTKAQYEPLPTGHYGLALEDYCHFTSPIRRYPDLAIHRILSVALDGSCKPQMLSRFQKWVKKAAALSSEREIAAMNAERSIAACYKAEAMRARIGEMFSGVVSGVSAQGLFVMLENTAEGFLPAQLLSRSILKVMHGVALCDMASGQRWCVGDRICVQIAAVDIAGGKIEFALA